VNFGEQAYRQFSGDPQAALEGEAFDYAVESYVTDGGNRSQVNQAAYNQATDLNNYSSYNIGRVIGRTFTGWYLRPLGVAAAVGDGGAALEAGGSFMTGVIYGSEN